MYKYRQNLMCISSYTCSGYCYKHAQDESGRSVVEMLGVLAIVGVLSITGIVGFKTAMDKYRANEIANDVGVARIKLEAAASLGNQGKTYVGLPSNSNVSLGSTSTYKNSGIVVDFKDDVGACKQFMQLYENSSDFYVLNACEE